MKRTKWIDRSFRLDLPEGSLPNVLERLHGTPIRIQQMTKGLVLSKTEEKPQGKWSIKEHVGHLSDLEDLHISRLNEILERKPELTAADMSNQATEDSNHNSADLNQLISIFDEKRMKFIQLLEDMNDEDQVFASLHPRLNIPMRPIDVAHFTAEHDDHHLASIRSIINESN